MSCLNKSDTLLVLEASTNTTPYGISRMISKRYPYADHVGSRRSLTYANSRAHWDDRAPLGSLQSCKEGNSPTVIYMIHAYGPGRAYEVNMYRQSVAQNTKDWQYAAGLKDDTLAGRLHAFKKCMENLEDIIRRDTNTNQRYTFLLPTTLEMYEKRIEHHVCQLRYIDMMRDLQSRYPHVDIQLCFKPAQEVDTIPNNT